MSLTPNRPQADTSPSDMVAQYNQNFDALDDQDRTKIIRNGTTPTLLFGYQKDGFGTGVDYGLKVAKSGKDVTTATATDLAFNSGYNHLKVVKTGEVTLAYPASMASGTGWTVTVNHGLGYEPAVVAYVNGSGSHGLLSGLFNYAVPQMVKPYAESTFANGFYLIDYAVNSANLSFTYFNGWNSTDPQAGDFYIKYYLLQESSKSTP